jgi:hypothetical protein
MPSGVELLLGLTATSSNCLSSQPPPLRGAPEDGKRLANGDQWSATFSYYNTENQYTLVKQVKVYCDLTCDSIFIS